MEVTTKLTVAAMPSFVLGPLAVTAVSDNLYAESPPSQLAGITSTSFYTSQEWTWLMHVQLHPPDTPDNTRCMLPSWRQPLLAPAPKPRWLLLGHESVTGQGHPALVLVSTQHMIEETPPQVKFKRGTWTLCLQWKQPQPSFRLLISGSVVSHPILERFKQCNSDGLMEATFSASEAHMPPLVDISMQQGSASLDPSFGPESSTTGIAIQISDTCSVLKIFWSTVVPCFLMTDFLVETKLLNTSLLNCRTSTARVLYRSAQFQ